MNLCLDMLDLRYIHMIHLARGSQEAVRVLIYSFSKYLSQVQKSYDMVPSPVEFMGNLKQVNR